MTHTVKKYNHRFTPPIWGLKLGRTVSRKVRFHESCIYTLPDFEQEDWNKLFGVSYISGPHKHSYRFGWRYDPVHGFIEISAYIYQGGARIMQKIGEVEVERDYDFEMRQEGNGVEFYINGQLAWVQLGKLPVIGWKLGPYFGGNMPAPKRMQIIIK